MCRISVKLFIGCQMLALMAPVEIRAQQLPLALEMTAPGITEGPSGGGG